MVASCILSVIPIFLVLISLTVNCDTTTRSTLYSDCRVNLDAQGARMIHTDFWLPSLWTSHGHGEPVPAWLACLGTVPQQAQAVCAPTAHRRELERSEKSRPLGWSLQEPVYLGADPGVGGQPGTFVPWRGAQQQLEQPPHQRVPAP